MLCRKIAVLTLASAVPALGQEVDLSPPTVAELRVDARDTPRKLLHVHLDLPIMPGEQTLLYPKWLPGEHGPTGPLSGLVGLKLTARGADVPWTRDPLEMYAVRCTVPDGAVRLSATYDFILPAGDGFTGGGSSTAKLLDLSWNHVALYVKGRPALDQLYRASLRLPPEWKLATALRTTKTEGDTTTFETVPLPTLVDSPVIAGEHLRTIPLAEGTKPAHYLDVVADSAAALEITPEHRAQLDRLVKEALALFGATHYDSYHFLLTLSDNVAHFGLEHHESSDNRVKERSLVDPDLRKLMAGLLPHEVVHSWCGKYRRPAGIAAEPFLAPQDTELLWIYEGLTSYLGFVLTARSGLLTPEQSREVLALNSAWLDRAPGRSWRPLRDTTVGAQFLYGAPGAWQAWRRSVDFYEEGTLVWLDVDVTIRAKTKGKRSLDDFCRAFFGGKPGRPEVVPYTLDDVVAALDAVAPHDWKGFFVERVDRIAPRAPLGGITEGGWRLSFAEEQTEMHKAYDADDKDVDLAHSLGFVAADDGVVKDVLPDGPAGKAGLAPGMRIHAVGGRKWSAEVVRRAVRDSEGKDAPIDILVEADAYFRVLPVTCADGERYPRLERDASRPDVLGAILAPRTSAPKR